jgi:hypothetical protein
MPPEETNTSQEEQNAGTPQEDTSQDVQAREVGQEQNTVQADNTGIPEGFDSWEAYGKAQLAKEAEAPKEESAEEAAAEETPTPEALDADTQKEVDERLEALPEATREGARPLFETMAREGDLTPEQRDEAAKVFGVTREMVDIYVNGFVTGQDTEMAPVYEAVGGKEAAKAVQGWAEEALSLDERKAFNADLAKDPVKAMTDLHARYKAEGNGAGATDITRGITSGGTQAAGYEGYTSEAAQSRAIADPRYARDPAYRATVEAKIAKTDFNLSRDYG